MSHTSTKIWAFGAVLLSGSLHALALVGLTEPSFQMPAGGEAAPPEMPLLGNDFADLAAGMSRPVSPQQTMAVSPKITPPTTARAAHTPNAPHPAQPTVQPAQAQTPAAQTAARASASKTLTAQTPKTRAPKARPTAAQGNAQRTAVRGRAEGQKTKPKAKITGQKSKQPSAAKPRAQPSMASYGAAVVRKIRSVRKQRVKGRGKVLVGFEIAPSGSLRSVRVVRSSGSGQLDRAALDHIRRAAPFPTPPKGRARFSFEFVNR